MTYAWEDKKDYIYQWYVVDRKPLDELIERLAEQGFTPSKRSYQTQFKRWKFPLKRNPAFKNEDIVNRVREMWEENYDQKAMLSTLIAEGVEISDRDLVKVRKKNGWMMRGRGDAAKDTTGADTENDNDADHGGQDIGAQLRRAVAEGDARKNLADKQRILPPQLTPEQQAEIERQKQEALEARKIHSDELWRARKRRRRTRGWAGLEPDPEGMPPRFPSETTLDESKVYLNLDNEQYIEMRDQFQNVCIEEEIERKVAAGPDKWEGAKQRLIRQNSHLQSIFWNSETIPSGDQREISLDVICMDVTKRMRTIAKHMSLSQAKNILKINPEQSRKLRQTFMSIVEANHFESKLSHGPEVWEHMKQTLKEQSDFLQGRFAGEADDAELVLKEKALEKVCRDVMKRLRDHKRTENPDLKFTPSTVKGPGPLQGKFAKPPPKTNDFATPGVEIGPGGRPRRTPASKPSAPYAMVRSNPQATISNIEGQAERPVSGISAQTSQTQARSAQQALAQTYSSQMQIDPSLLLAASDLSQIAGHFDPIQQDFGIPGNHSNAYTSSQHQIHPSYQPHAQQQQLSQASKPSAIPCYFRLHPLSPVQQPPKLWLNVLRHGTVAEIRQLAASKHAGARVIQLEGVVKDQGESEIVYAIDEEEELEGYLAHVDGGKVTFVVRLG